MVREGRRSRGTHDSVELGALVTETLLSSSESPEVLDSNGDASSVELSDTERRTTSGSARRGRDGQLRRGGKKGEWTHTHGDSTKRLASVLDVKEDLSKKDT